MNYSESANSGAFKSSINNDTSITGKGRMAGDAFLSKFQFDAPNFQARSRVDPQAYGTQQGMIDPAAQVRGDYATVANKAEQQRREKLTSVPLRETSSMGGVASSSVNPTRPTRTKRRR